MSTVHGSSGYKGHKQNWMLKGTAKDCPDHFLSKQNGRTILDFSWIFLILGGKIRTFAEFSKVFKGM